MKTSVLVTGGAGYIGSHTCALLAEHGLTPVTLDNLVYGHREAVRWGPFYQGAISDQGLVQKIIQEHKIQSVIHFAAYAYVGESVSDPLKYYQNNVAETVAFLQTLVQESVKEIVFSSTCAVYGNPQVLPLDENHPQHPINPYGASKAMVERILQDLTASKKIKAVALRYFNAAGAGNEYGLGEDHDPETHLIPLVLRSAQGMGSPLTIFGDDYSTPDGSCLRDYVHVLDLGEAHVKALEYLKTSTDAFSVFNLGTEKTVSNFEIISAAEKVVGKNIPFARGPRRAGDPAELRADAGKAHRLLGWKPSRSDIQNILQTAWKWHQDQIQSAKNEGKKS